MALVLKTRGHESVPGVRIPPLPQRKFVCVTNGNVAERMMALVSKTGGGKTSAGSNPVVSASIYLGHVLCVFYVQSL